jgi:hypothetical protein
VAIDLANLTAEVELVLVKENLITLKNEALAFVRITAEGGLVISECFAIFPAD